MPARLCAKAAEPPRRALTAIPVTRNGSDNQLGMRRLLMSITTAIIKTTMVGHQASVCVIKNPKDIEQLECIRRQRASDTRECLVDVFRESAHPGGCGERD